MSEDTLMAPPVRKKRCRCGRVHSVPPCRVKDRPRPEDPGRDDITGRYEQDAAKPQFTCQLNQAGAHIEGWLQFVYAADRGRTLPATAAARLRQVFTLSGDRDRRNGEFRFAVYDDWSPEQRGQGVGQGFLRPRGRDRVELSMTIGQGRGPAETIRTMLRPYPYGGKVPRLSNHALASLPGAVREELRVVETHPLPTPFVTELRADFSPQWVRQRLAQWYSVQNKPPSERDRVQRPVLGAVEGRLRAFFLRFHRELWPTIRWHIRMHLSCYRFEQGSTRTLLEDLAFIATRTARSAEDKFEFIGEEGLGLSWTPAPPTEPFVYKAKLRLWQIQVGKSTRPPRPKIPEPQGSGAPAVSAGVARGTLVVAKYGPGIKAPVIMHFDVRFTVVGAALDVGMAVYSENDALEIIDDDWQASDFQGDAVMFDVSGWVASPFAGGSLGVSKLRIYGSKAYPPITFDLTGPSPVRGGGAGIGGSFLFGDLTPKGQKPAADVPEARTREFPLTGAASNKSHFDLGCAVLDTEGRETIRRFCAQELFYLQSPHSVVRIEADTDRVDCRWRNEELSKLRADNAFQAIKDTLGKKAPVAFLGTERKGYGEVRAKNIGNLADDTEDRTWRKVEVYLNGRGMMRLFSGSPDPTPPR
jgi:hypothetical protein